MFEELAIPLQVARIERVANTSLDSVREDLGIGRTAYRIHT